jgi:hypothetical protein
MIYSLGKLRDEGDGGKLWDAMHRTGLCGRRQESDMHLPQPRFVAIPTGFTSQKWLNVIFPKQMLLRKVL